MNDEDISQNSNLEAESSSIQVGGGKTYSEHPEHWKMPIELNSALDKTAITYRKRMNEQNTMNLPDRMKQALSTFTDCIEKEITIKREIKYFFTIKLMFHQSKDIEILTDPPVTFRTDAYTSLNMENVNTSLESTYKKFIVDIEGFQQRGSGWVLDHFIYIDIGKTIISSLVGKLEKIKCSSLLGCIKQLSLNLIIIFSRFRHRHI